MSLGKSVRLFLADGTPGGITTAEIINWTGHVVSCSRSDLATLLARDESSRTGIYLLIGANGESLNGLDVYVGEGDSIGARLKVHAAPTEKGGKDFWDRCVILTSKDQNLTKAHARYLESRFIEVVEKAQRATLVNGTRPPIIPLPEADISDMEYFIEQSKIVLPVLGVNVLRSTQPMISGSAGPVVEAAPQFELKVDSKAVLFAYARDIDGEFTVLAGSYARNSWSGVHSSYESLRDKLEKDGTISLDGSGRKVFARNHVFSSVSAASATILGRSSNGRLDWVETETGMKYGNWQSSQIETIPTDSSFVEN